MKSTHYIAKGKIKIDPRIAENLLFSIRKGYSDQDVIYWGEVMSTEIDRAKRLVNKMVK
jgi:hypothetical protein